MKGSYLIKPELTRSYPTAAYGKGVYIYDQSNKRYLDGSSGAVTALIGHGNSEIIEAMKKQAEKISFVYRTQFTTEQGEQLAEELGNIDFIKDEGFHSFFVNSGSEALETAMKIAIQYWQERGRYEKQKIISRWTSYHGITMGALSLSGHSERRRRFVSVMEQHSFISPPYCYRCPFQRTFPSCQLRCASQLEEEIVRIGPNSVAAFVAEPIVGAAGTVIVPPQGYYEKIKEICNRYDILLIADEVMTSLGRTGKYFALEYWGVIPDILALGKGLGAGYTPIGATLVRGKVMEAFFQGSKLIMSGHTYSANPQSCAVSLAVLKYLKDHSLVKRGERKGETLKQKLLNLMHKYEIIGDVRGKGLMIGIEFIQNRKDQTPFPKSVGLTNFIVNKAQENGLIIYPSSCGVEGGDGDGIIVAPPLIITEEQIDELVHLLDKTLNEVEQTILNKGEGNG